MHRHTAWEQRVVGLLWCTAMLLGSSGQQDSCCAFPHCWGVVGSGSRARCCHTTRGQWDSFCTPSHHWGAVGSESPPVHRHTAGKQWAVDGSPQNEVDHGLRGRMVPPCLWSQPVGCLQGMASPTPHHTTPHCTDRQTPELAHRTVPLGRAIPHVHTSSPVTHALALAPSSQDTPPNPILMRTPPPPRPPPVRARHPLRADSRTARA